MDTKMAPAYANLFVGKLEEKMLANHTIITFLDITLYKGEGLIQANS